MKSTGEKLIFCQNVKKLRMQNNITKNEMAQIMHIGVDSLSLLESGTLPQRMSVSAVVYVAQYFDIQIKNLFAPNLGQHEPPPQSE